VDDPGDDHVDEGARPGGQTPACPPRPPATVVVCGSLGTTGAVARAADLPKWPSSTIHSPYCGHYPKITSHLLEESEPVQ
jgi:hypothetical protein